MKRRLHLAIDSKFRQHDRYPNAWRYAVGLPEPLHNVVAVDLVRAFMPNTQQTVHTFNNVFQCTPVGRQTITVTIPPGNYEPTLLLTYVRNALQDAGLANPQLSLATDTNIVTVSADEPFVLPFGSGDKQPTSIHRYLGFSNVDTQAGLTAVAFYAMALPPPTFVTVRIDEVPRMGCRRAYRMEREVPAGFNTRPELQERLYTGLVPMDTDFQTFKFHAATALEVLQQEFPPIDLRQLTVSIEDDKGNPYDANGYDHSLVLQAVTLEPPEVPLMCPGNNRLPGPSPWGARCRLP